MPRYKLTIEYDGGPYKGWQRQPNGPSIQQSLEEAVTAFTGEVTEVAGAGRTDAGVHAEGQVAHVHLQTTRYDGRGVQNALNALLRPQPISVIAAEIVPDGFHARFSAVERAYRYRIVDRFAPLALDMGRAWHVLKPLDVEAMNEAAQRLVGHHDFTSFRATYCQAKSPVKTLDKLEVVRLSDSVEVRAVSRSFLHHQVRNMTGTLKLVGEGKWTADDVTAALEARSRAAAGPTAPADGLYLTRVSYPD